MIDLGTTQAKTEYPDKDYEPIYLPDLEVGDEMTGKIRISEIKTKDFKGKTLNSFYLLVINDEAKQKWVLGINTSVFYNDGETKIYGAKGGRVYQLVDSLENVCNGTELNERKSYSVDFDKFKETINEKIATATVEAVDPSNANAKSPNIMITDVVFAEDVEE